MKKKRRQITDESLQAIISAIKKSAEKVPPSYFTIKDYMKKWNMSETQTRRLISEAKELNILDTKVFRTVDSYNRIMPTNYYSIKKTLIKKMK